MAKILIINNCLIIGGAEKLVFELVNFALENNIQPTVLIPDSYATEYYDPLLKAMNVRVVRTRLGKFHRLRNPKNLYKALSWKLKLRYFAKEFDAIHVVNLGTAERVSPLIKHSRRYFWHIGNSIQFDGNILPFNGKLFENPLDTIVFINKYQRMELEHQYKDIRCKKIEFKLFITSNK